MNRLSNEAGYWTAIYANFLGLTVFGLVFYLFNIRKIVNKKIYYIQRTSLVENTAKLYMLISPFVFAFHIIYVGDVPILAAMHGYDSASISELREVFDKRLPLLEQLIFFMNERVFPLILTVLLIAGAPKIRKSITYLLILWIFAISAAGMVKALPVITAAVILFSIAEKRGFNVILAAFLFFPLILVSLGFMGYLARGGSEIDIIGIVYDLVLRRIYQVQADVSIAYFSIFPQRIDFLYGYGIRAISLLLGDSAFQLANVVYLEMFQFDREYNESGWANTGYLGEAWADFGWLGVLLYSTIIAVAIKITESFIKNYKETSPEKSLVLNIFSVYIVASLAFSSVFSSALLLMVVFGWLTMKLFFFED